jgi:hypothetical protein
VIDHVRSDIYCVLKKSSSPSDWSVKGSPFRHAIGPFSTGGSEILLVDLRRGGSTFPGQKILQMFECMLT